MRGLFHRHRHTVFATLAVMFVLFVSTAHAEIAARDGWVILPTAHSYPALVKRIDQAAKVNKIAVCHARIGNGRRQESARSNHPGNMVIGLYHPRFAVRMLRQVSRPASKHRSGSI